jgi:DNA primase catalytic subunit
MKTWKNFFEVNEDHKEGEKEQADWICSKVSSLSGEQVDTLYKFMEKEFGLEGK